MEKQPTELEIDSLAACLVGIAKFHRRPTAKESLIANLPLSEKGHLTPAGFVEAAHRINLEAEIIEIPFESIPELSLPCVLLLRNGEAAILFEKADNHCLAFIPSQHKKPSKISTKTLESLYNDQAIMIRVEYLFEKRVDTTLVEEKKMHWFWSVLWRFKSMYARVIIASFFINLFAIAMPLFIMNVYDRVIPTNSFDTLWVFTIGIIIIVSFDFIFKSLRVYFIDKAGEKVDILLSSALLEHSINIQMESQPASSGIQAGHIKEFEAVRDFFTSATVASFIDLPFIFIFIAVIALIAGSIAFVPIIAVACVLLITILLSIPMAKAVNASFVSSAQKSALLYESLASVETLKTTNAQAGVLSRWQNYAAKAAKYSLKSRFYSNLAQNICTFAIYAVSIVVVILGVFAIASQKMTVGALIATVILSGRALAPLGNITNLLTRFQQTRCSLGALDKLMQLPLDRNPKHHYVHRETFEGDIILDRVTFKYPTQPVAFFKDFSLHISPGEKVAIIGNIGSGKTTLYHLILGLYLPTAGSVKIDGIDIRQLDPLEIRKHIGYISQNPKLFFGTARDNIAMKSPWIDDQAVIEAAKLSGADEFIRQHPLGYMMPIGEGGKGLSGGQLQAIALARAFLPEPQILLLDEPTTSMDTRLEEHVVTAMKEYFKNKTVLITTHTHRLMHLVDRIVILHQGKIVADGPREEIVEKLKAVRSQQGKT